MDTRLLINYRSTSTLHPSTYISRHYLPSPGPVTVVTPSVPIHLLDLIPRLNLSLIVVFFFFSVDCWFRTLEVVGSQVLVVVYSRSVPLPSTEVFVIQGSYSLTSYDESKFTSFVTLNWELKLSHL